MGNPMTERWDIIGIQNVLCKLVSADVSL